MTEKDIVWSTRVDKSYQVEVIRTGDYTANLVVMDGDKELLKEQVNLAFKALFGPDVADVADWQARVIRFIDEELPK